MTDLSEGSSLTDIIKRACLDAFPVYVPAIPFAIVVGIAINDSAMPRWVGILSTPVIWAGSAQFATISLAGSASWLTLVLTGAIINSRHIMYSAAISPRFADQPRWFRWFGPYLLVDQVFAMIDQAPELSGRVLRRYYLSIGAFFFVAWHLFVAVGLFAGTAVPDSWQLGAAPAIMFAGLAIFGATRKPAVVAVVVAAGVSALTLQLPNRLGLLVGAFAGVAAGWFAEQRYQQKVEPADDTSEPTT